MLLDWFTIFAQIFNFLILMFLLRRFLYRPILDAMENRERLIEDRLEQAEQKQQHAEEEHQRYLRKNQELREHYDQKKHEAEEEVHSWRKEALHTARQEVETTVEEWRKSIRLEKDSFVTELRQFAVQQAYAVAGQAIRDLSDASLEERILEAFLARLKRQEIDLEQLKQSVNSVLTFRSAFELSPAQQERVQSELKAYYGEDLPLRFETVPELTAGIELAGQEGYQVAWNLHRYLEALEEEVEVQFQQLSHETDQASKQMEIS